jgi:hypothetical protein
MAKRVSSYFLTLLPIAFVTGCATTPATPAVEIPATLSVPADQKLALILEATGVQIYDCAPAKAPAVGNVWTFRAPEAELRDQAGNPFGRHYGGPTWEAKDGSKVVGVVKAKENAPAPTAIPWLLLSTGATYGHGALEQTKSIQRLKTVGGQPPSADCASADLGREMRVPYQAEYRFYVAAP